MQPLVDVEYMPIEKSIINYPNVIRLRVPIGPLTLYESILKATYLPYLTGYIENEDNITTTAINQEQLVISLYEKIKEKNISHINDIAKEINKEIYLIDLIEQSIKRTNLDLEESIILGIFKNGKDIIHYEVIGLMSNSIIELNFLNSHQFIIFLQKLVGYSYITK